MHANQESIVSANQESNAYDNQESDVFSNLGGAESLLLVINLSPSPMYLVLSNSLQCRTRIP